jgi:hypothetical protein
MRQSRPLLPAYLSALAGPSSGRASSDGRSSSSVSAVAVWKETTTQSSSPITGRCQTFSGIEIHRSPRVPDGSLDNTVGRHELPFHICMSPDPLHDIMRWMLFGCRSAPLEQCALSTNTQLDPISRGSSPNRWGDIERHVSRSVGSARNAACTSATMPARNCRAAGRRTASSSRARSGSDSTFMRLTIANGAPGRPRACAVPSRQMAVGVNVSRGDCRRQLPAGLKGLPETLNG